MSTSLAQSQISGICLYRVYAKSLKYPGIRGLWNTPERSSLTINEVILVEPLVFSRGITSAIHYDVVTSAGEG